MKRKGCIGVIRRKRNIDKIKHKLITGKMKTNIYMLRQEKGNRNIKERLPLNMIVSGMKKLNS